MTWQPGKKAPMFNERAATQMAGELLRLRGGSMKFLKLIKLMYLVEREALLRWGIPITQDRLVAMPKGQVLSRTYDLIREEVEPGIDSYWKTHISDPNCNYDVSIKGSIPADELSQAQMELVREIFSKFGMMNRWKLVHYLHTLPEWSDPNGSSFPIEYKDIFKAAGKSDDEIERLSQENDYFAWVEQQFS